MYQSVSHNLMGGICLDDTVRSCVGRLEARSWVHRSVILWFEILDITVRLATALRETTATSSHVGLGTLSPMRNGMVAPPFILLRRSRRRIILSSMLLV